ncbi:hypothetical protein IAE22_28580, partial [Bacillus sp. S34]|nr:hypothetical protein [Bacillus sp. S34]
MIVVGIDPSLACTGLSFIDGDHVWTSRVRTANLGGGLVSRRRRIRQAHAQIMLQMPERALFVIERPSERSQFGQHNERVALYWFLIDALLPRGPVVEVGPTGRAKYEPITDDEAIAFYVHNDGQRGLSLSPLVVDKTPATGGEDALVVNGLTVTDPNGIVLVDDVS